MHELDCVRYFTVLYNALYQGGTKENRDEHQQFVFNWKNENLPLWVEMFRWGGVDNLKLLY